MLNVERQGNVAVWTVDRPSARNALDHATIAKLCVTARAAADDRELRAVVLTGAGEAFVSGGDLRELRDLDRPEDAGHLTDAGHELTLALAELPFPVIAAISGPAIGGGAELALACDLRVADGRARIAFKQVRMGVTTAWGSVPHLVATVGASAAARLLFTGREVGAAEAKELGLVDEVTEDGQALQTALEWAAEVTLGSPTAVASMKRLLRAAAAASVEVRALEREAFIETWTGADHKDAVRAYFERRPAHWQPRR